MLEILCWSGNVCGDKNIILAINKWNRKRPFRSLNLLCHSVGLWLIPHFPSTLSCPWWLSDQKSIRPGLLYIHIYRFTQEPSSQCSVAMSPKANNLQKKHSLISLLHGHFLILRLSSLVLNSSMSGNIFSSFISPIEAYTFQVDNLSNQNQKKLVMKCVLSGRKNKRSVKVWRPEKIEWYMVHLSWCNEETANVIQNARRQSERRKYWKYMIQD